MSTDGQWQPGQWQPDQAQQQWQPQQPQQPPQPPPWQGQYGQAPYGQPWQQPAQPWQQPAQPYWPQQLAWPQGPGRPGLATASAVLGIVTGSLTAIGGLALLVGCLTGDGDLPSWLLALGLPIGVVLLIGGIGLLSRRHAALVLWSSVAAVAVLLIALVAGAATLHDDDVEGLLAFTVLALPLPIVTAALTAQRTVRAWAAGDPGQRSRTSAPYQPRPW